MVFFKDKDIILNNMKNLENIHGRMDLIMMDNGSMVKEMAMVHFSWKILWIMKDNGWMIKNMEKAKLNIKEVIDSMVNGNKIKL